MIKPTASTITLTPEKAAELLDRNPRNRRVSAKNYSMIKRAIERGEWELNGEAIKVAVDGFLLDGQHRCHAVIETGIPIETFLIEGLPNRTQDTMDTGKIRTLGNVLDIRGEKSATRLAAIVTSLHAMETFGLRAGVHTGRRDPVTVKERLDYLEQNPWIRDILEPLRGIQRASHYSGVAMLAPLYVTFANIDEEDAEFFWSRVRDGLELHEKSPIYVLRKTLRTISEDSRGERNTLYIAAITIKAWNAYRDGADVSQLRWRAGGAKPEAFPEPR